jgi:hypothetical protein
MNVVEICAYVWKWKNETCRNYSHATILKEEQGEKRQKKFFKKRRNGRDQDMVAC